MKDTHHVWAQPLLPVPLMEYSCVKRSLGHTSDANGAFPYTS